MFGFIGHTQHISPIADCTELRGSWLLVAVSQFEWFTPGFSRDF